MKFQETQEFKEVLEKTYKNCEGCYVTFEENETPFFLVKSKIFGEKIINVPFFDTGSLPADLSKKNIKKIKEKFVDSPRVEIRMDDSFENFENIKKSLVEEGFESNENKHQMVIHLKQKEEMWNQFHKHTRNDVRKSEKSGLTIKPIKEVVELKKFYKLYLREMKNFGTPQHSFSFFRNFLEIMRENFLGLNCYYNKELAGAIILFYDSEEAYLGFNVSNIHFREYRPNDKLYWEMMKFCIEKKIKKISLGQVDLDSEDPRAKGLYKFKAKWLSVPVKRVYFNYPKEEDQNQKKESMKKFRSVWKRLPLWMVRIVGPKIESQLGI